MLDVLPEAVTVPWQCSQAEANVLRAEKRERKRTGRLLKELWRKFSQIRSRNYSGMAIKWVVLEQLPLSLSLNTRPVACIQQLVILHWGEIVTVKNAHDSHRFGE